MKAFLCLPLWFAAAAWGDEAGDRRAIERIIVAINESPPAPALFTADSDAQTTLEALRPWVARSGRPAVVISHEPWGEATISWSAACHRIVSPSVRFITSDVAIADATCANGEAGGKSLLFVMKKEGADWKIASLRLLAPR